MVDADASEELLSFHSSVDDPRLQPDPAVLAKVAWKIRLFRKGATELGLNAEFTRTMSGRVVEAFRRLDALPRSDRFWEGTNRRPNEYRLSGFCEKLLRDRPGDILAIWMRAAVASVIAHYFHPPTWIRLMAVARPEITWPVSAALCGEFLGSYDTARDLATVLTESGRVREALLELSHMKKGAGKAYVSNWAGNVIDELNQVGQKRDA
jgi:hypothetical protein